MPLLSFKDYTIRDRNGHRVPASECKFQPLNLFLPGKAPILVPDKRNEKQDKKRGNTSNIDTDAETNNETRKKKARRDSTRSTMPTRDYANTLLDTEDDQDDDADHGGYFADIDDEAMQPLLGVKKKEKAVDNPKAKTKSENKSKSRIQKLLLQDSSRNNKQDVSAKQKKNADKQQQSNTEKSQKGRKGRISKQQEDYITRLVAKYRAREKKKRQMDKGSTPSSSDVDSDVGIEGSSAQLSDEATVAEKTTTADQQENTSPASLSGNDGASTDTSSSVRNLLAKLKIRAGGKDAGEAFTESEEFQLLAMKKNGETWSEISNAMFRPMSELIGHYIYLQNKGTKIPGEDDDDGGVKRGDSDSSISDTGAMVGDGIANGEPDKASDMAVDKSELESTSEDEKRARERALVKAIKAQGKSTEEGKSGRLHKVRFSSTLLRPVSRRTSSSKRLKNKSHKGSPRRTKKKGKEKTTKIEQEKTSSEDTTQSSTEAQAAGDESSSDFTGNGLDIKAYIGQYGKQVIKDHNAGRITIPEADNNFDEDDCVLLALTNNRHADDRWLHIQAEFANLTGRLVPKDVLRWKLGEGEKPEDY